MKVRIPGEGHGQWHHPTTETLVCPSIDTINEGSNLEIHNASSD